MWRALPADFLPASTVYYYWADKWQADGSTETMHDKRGRIRELAAIPSAQIVSGGG